MRRAALFVVLTMGIHACVSASSETTPNANQEKIVEIDGLHSKAPAEWKSEAPTNQLRYAQFKLPKHKDDKDDAELVIFKGLGGSSKQNVERWKATFVPPTGKTIDQASKLEELKIAGRPATYLDISGSLKYKERPADPASKEELRADYRMLAVHFDGTNDVYHIKLTGPAKTVAMYKKGFDEWLKALK